MYKPGQNFDLCSEARSDKPAVGYRNSTSPSSLQMPPDGTRENNASITSSLLSKDERSSLHEDHSSDKAVEGLSRRFLRIALYDSAFRAPCSYP